MSNLVEHAKRELKLAGYLYKEKDFYGGNTGKAVLQLIKVFAKQGHSGMSASLVRQLFNSLSDYKTITPLTGEDDEWCEFGEGRFQNNRCCSIFKDDKMFKGQAYWIDGKVFSDDRGKTWFTGKGSVVPINFPYDTNTKSEYIILNPLQVFIRNLRYNLKYNWFKKKKSIGEESLTAEIHENIKGDTL